MNYSWIILIVGSLLVTIATTHHIDTAFCQRAAEKLQTEQEANTIAAQNNVIKKEQSDASISQKIDQHFQATVAGINQQYASSVQPASDSTSNHLPAAPNAPGGFNGGTCQATRKQYQVIAAQLTALQEWVRETTQP